MGKHLFLLVGCLLVARRSFVSSAPHGGGEVPGGGGGNAGVPGGPGTPTDTTQDENVKELERLKPLGNSLAVIKTHSSVFANINGQKQQHSKTKEEVEKNGEVLARLSQEVDKAGGVPPHVKTALDIPSRNIHRVMEQGPKDLEQESKTAINPMTNRPPGSFRLEPNFSMDQEQLQKGDLPMRPPSSLHYSPLDMAEYVFWTGDEKGVTSAIEDFLQNGLMSREEAIGFLQDIKQNLDYLQSHYTDERYRSQQQGKEGERPTSQMNPITGFGEQMSLFQDKIEDRGSSELAEVRQQMQDNLNKKSELQDPLQTSGLSEEDYEDLIERLKAADFLYNEYSLEEIIYQLAKLMFTQSLTRGSAEAQDALQKFTSFLELEAQQGRISRNLEKKVLDVLIASLSDTLTEHPELVSTARESLGAGIPQNDMSSFVSQGKPGSENQNGMDVKSHRFQPSPGNILKKTLQNSGLVDQDKKST